MSYYVLSFDPAVQAFNIVLSEIDANLPQYGSGSPIGVRAASRPGIPYFDSDTNSEYTATEADGTVDGTTWIQRVYSISAATTTTLGTVTLATQSDVNAGTSTTAAVTPATLGGLARTTDLTAETNARVAADSNLQAQIDSIGGGSGSVGADVDNSANTTVSNNTLVRRDAHGRIAIADGVANTDGVNVEQLNAVSTIANGAASGVTSNASSISTLTSNLGTTNSNVSTLSGTVTSQGTSISSQGTSISNLNAETTQMIGGSAIQSLTVASNTISPSVAVNNISASSVTNLNLIAQTNYPNTLAQPLQLTNNGAFAITLKHAQSGTGAMYLDNAVDFALNPGEVIVFNKVGSTWVEAFRSSRILLNNLPFLSSIPNNLSANSSILKGNLIVGSGAGALSILAPGIGYLQQDINGNFSYSVTNSPFPYIKALAISNTSNRQLPTTGAISGTYWHFGNWIQTGNITCAHGTRIYLNGTMTFVSGFTFTVGFGMFYGSSLLGPQWNTGTAQAGQNGFGIGGGLANSMATTGASGGGGGGNGGWGGWSGSASANNFNWGGPQYSWQSFFGGSSGAAGNTTGATATAGYGGRGGGGVYIETSGAISLSGAAASFLLAKGETGNPPVTATAGGGGGGSGGTVIIRCGSTINLGTSSTAINATGANGSNGFNTSSGGGGGGGGGIIDIVASSTVTHSMTASSACLGGNGGTGSTVQTAGSGATGILSVLASTTPVSEF